ncbi:MAG: ankyrin repeat domain-containing protein [Acidobacteria bacterium]|nr:ankyrin repeat domain-containing protein [Acidobacteriota bacterium]
MNDPERDLMAAFETHDADGIRTLLDAGIDAAVPIDGKLPIDWLTEMYFRSDRFPACLRALLDRGARLADPRTAAALLDDAHAIGAEPALATHRTSMVSCFTPLVDATLLHVAAEYGHVAAARALLDAGADPNARAGVDPDGLGGHTPIFHTVNSNANRSLPVMQLLLERGAAVDVRVDGVTWGKGFEWETTLFDLTPIAYCQLGNLPQMHRNESDIAANVRALLAAAGRPVPAFPNVPNRYLRPKGRG